VFVLLKIDGLEWKGLGRGVAEGTFWLLLVLFRICRISIVIHRAREVVTARRIKRSRSLHPGGGGVSRLVSLGRILFLLRDDGKRVLAFLLLLGSGYAREVVHQLARLRRVPFLLIVE
jgi:hypothetical protein